MSCCATGMAVESTPVTSPGGFASRAADDKLTSTRCVSHMRCTGNSPWDVAVLQVVRTTIAPAHRPHDNSYDAYEYTAHSHTYNSFEIPSAKARLCALGQFAHQPVPACLQNFLPCMFMCFIGAPVSITQACVIIL